MGDWSASKSDLGGRRLLRDSRPGDTLRTWAAPPNGQKWRASRIAPTLVWRTSQCLKCGRVWRIGLMMVLQLTSMTQVLATTSDCLPIDAVAFTKCYSTGAHILPQACVG